MVSVMRSSLICTLAATSVFAAIPLATATAAGPSEQATSSNWAGYVVNSPSDADGFRKVSGSWVQPRVDCSSMDGKSSLWVGLGGQSSSEQTGLEQTGTAADCDSGQATYYAWYELIPAAPVQLNMAISPGDRISASVTVNGTAVRIQLADHTTGKWFDRTVHTNSIDVSSAEWIAEAPSACDESGCTPEPLADFGTARITGVSATTTAGHKGSISDNDWQALPMALAGSSVSAQVSSVNSAGTAFSVSTADGGAAVDPSGGGGSGYGSDPYGGGYGSDPYGDGSGYGADPYGDGSGYGSDPYSGGGYGSDPYGDGSGYGSDPYGGGSGWDGGGSGDGFSF
jgi:Peptidase A4 family